MADTGYVSNKRYNSMTNKLCISCPCYESYAGIAIADPFVRPDPTEIHGVKSH